MPGPTYNVITIPLSAALVDLEIVVSTPKLVIFNSDFPSTIKLGDDTQDPLPSRSALEMCSDPGDVIDKIFVSTAGGAATDVLVLVAVLTGNINLFA